MAKIERMTRFERQIANRDAHKKAEAAGEVADSMDVRMKLMERVHSGEITLEAAQAELAKIKRNAKRSGLKTRDQFYRSR
jgi:hypothetical protein